jgi:CBS domain-containing protein
MTPDPVVLRDTDPLDKGMQILLEKHLHALPVVDAEGRYLGLFDVPSVFRAMLPRVATFDEDLVDLSFLGEDIQDLRIDLPNDKPVSDFLDTEVDPIAPDLSVMETLHKVFRCRCALPVVDPGTGRLVGMISPWGALAAIERRRKVRP